MKVVLGSTTYHVGWRYTQVDSTDDAAHLADVASTCIISKIVDDETSEEVALATAKCSTKDEFIRSVGRKISLTRALEVRIPNPLNPAGDWVPVFSKEDRSKIWAEYFNMINKQTNPRITLHKDQIVALVKGFAAALVNEIVSAGKVIKR